MPLTVNGEFLQWLMERGITPSMRTRDSALRKNNPLYGPDRFTCLPESNSYLGPAGQPLNFVGLNVRNRTHAYIGSRKRCGVCPQKRNAPLASTSIWPSTSTNLPDHALANWLVLRPLPTSNGNEKR